MLGLALSIMGSFAGQESGPRYSLHKTLIESRHAWGILTSSRFCIFKRRVSFDVDLRGYAIRFGKFLQVVVLGLVLANMKLSRCEAVTFRLFAGTASTRDSEP